MFVQVMTDNHITGREKLVERVEASVTEALRRFAPQITSVQVHLADENSHCINWEVAPNRRTLYAVPMSGNQLYAYDLTGTGDTLAGKSLGKLHATAESTDCRAMCVGPGGDVCIAVTETGSDLGISNLLHLVRYRKSDAATVDLGTVSISNPDFTEFKDKEGKPLPFHGGFVKLADGTTTTQYVIMGVAQARDGAVYILAIHPYSVLRVVP